MCAASCLFVYFVVNVILLDEYVVLISDKMTLFRFNFLKTTLEQTTKQFFQCHLGQTFFADFQCF